jgi:anti-sigma B factor antagonist
MGEEIDLEIAKMTDRIAVVVLKSPSMSDVDAIAAASGKIQQFVRENQPQTLIFDFEAVKFFSSLVLGLLLDIRAKMTAYQGEVLISAINPQLHRVFRITNLDRIFRFFPDRESAVEAASSD